MGRAMKPKPVVDSKATEMYGTVSAANGHRDTFGLIRLHGLMGSNGCQLVYIYNRNDCCVLSAILYALVRQV